MKRILIIDTSILCIWLNIPGMDTCGPDKDRWNNLRVQAKINEELAKSTTFVLPLATIIETGNHIAKTSKHRKEIGNVLADLMRKSADAQSPWAAFSDQNILWSAEKLKSLADSWPDLAEQKLSLGDATIKDVAEYYAQMGCYEVEILTGDQGLKAYQPLAPIAKPRRKRGR